MKLTLEIELTKGQVRALKAVNDYWESFLGIEEEQLPHWAYRTLPTMMGSRYYCGLTELGKQAREKLLSLAKEELL